MESVESIVIYDRQHAGKMLSERLHEYKDCNGVVIGIPRGGVLVASAIAEELNLPLDIMSCRKVSDPSDRQKSLGSVSNDEVILHDIAYDLPQAYLFHQLELIRHGVQQDDRFYHEHSKSLDLAGKIVILADDVLKTSDTITSCLKSVRRQNPKKIIVACAIVMKEAVCHIDSLVEGLVFLRMGQELAHGDSFFQEFPKVDERLVRNMLLKSRENDRHIG